MANVSLHQLLGAPTVTRVVSRIKLPMQRLQNFLGMQPGGANVNPYGGRVFQYDVMNGERKISVGRAPGTGPARRAPQKVGQVNVGAYRSYEAVHLDDNRLHRNRPLGGQWGTVDARGVNYVTRQERRLAQLFRNNREFMVSRMLRGSFQVKVDGDDWVPVDTGGQFTIDYQIPAGNKSQLDMLGAGDILDVSWATIASADIPKHLFDINAAFEELHGYPLRHVWLNSSTFSYVLNNSKLQSLAGTANRVFTAFRPTGERNEEGVEDTSLTATLAGVPWVTFHIYDGGLEVDGSFTKFIPDNYAVFMADPDPNISEMYEGSEYIREQHTSEPRENFGLGAWTTPTIDPAGFDLKGLDVSLPVLYVPTAIAYGQVVF